MHPVNLAGCTGQSDHTNNQRLQSETKKTLSGGKPPRTPDDRFEEAWKLYPKRSGNNPRHDALKGWTARLREGADPAAILAGVTRYARWCELTKKIQTEYVMRASTFFGPGKCYEQDWHVPAEIEKAANDEIKDSHCVMDINGHRCSRKGDVSVGDGFVVCTPCYSPGSEPTQIEAFIAKVRAAKAKRLAERAPEALAA